MSTRPKIEIWRYFIFPVALSIFIFCFCSAFWLWYAKIRGYHKSHSTTTTTDCSWQADALMQLVYARSQTRGGCILNCPCTTTAYRNLTPSVSRWGTRKSIIVYTTPRYGTRFGAEFIPQAQRVGWMRLDGFYYASVI